MNNQVIGHYNEYRKLTEGDTTAAGCLVLAAALRECRPIPLADQPLTVPEVAKFLRVSPDKVLSWIRSGRLRGFNVAETETGRPKYRVSPEELEAFINVRMPFQPPRRGRPVGRRRRFPALPDELPSL
jgi:excisionase family DNA binding protein